MYAVEFFFVEEWMWCYNLYAVVFFLKGLGNQRIGLCDIQGCG